MKKSLLCSVYFLSLLSAWAQPTGTIMPFAGPSEKVPAGWVLCDGKLYDSKANQYKVLFSVIGTAWGGAAVDQFAVPDLRGLFLRGVSEATDVDPEKNGRPNSRPDLNAPGNGGNAVGSKQADGFGYHNHGFTDNGHRHRVAGGWSVNNGNARAGGGELTNGGLSRDSHYSTTDVSNISFKPEGGAETRPKNAYVYYIIKL